MALERIPNQVGYLVLNEDGAVLSVRKLQINWLKHENDIKTKF